MRIIIIISTIFLMAGCCPYDDEDFAFSEDYNALFKAYNVGDTLFFANARNDLDTLTISHIDSFQQCGGIMGFPRRNISIAIQHLPANLWTGGIELYENNSQKILDQDLIAIEKTPTQKENPYYFGFSFRSFQASIDTMPAKEEGNLLNHLGIKEFWRIKTDLPSEFQKGASVVEIIWTAQYGLTGYFKKNGVFYLIKTGYSRTSAPLHDENHVECFFDNVSNDSLVIYDSINGNPIITLAIEKDQARRAWYKIAVKESSNGWAKIESIMVAPRRSRYDSINQQLTFFTNQWVRIENLTINLGDISLPDSIGVPFYAKPDTSAELVCRSGTFLQLTLLDTEGTWAKVSFVHHGTQYIAWIEKKNQCASPWTSCPFYPENMP